jgi:hypothetical protein
VTRLLTREEFKKQVFERDDNNCIVCGGIAVDAHHIIERKLFEDGGYYLDNGASLCERHHIDAEQGVITVEELRELAGITNIILPPTLKQGVIYDKWGKEISETKYIKYHRTFHLPWSEKVSNDDRVLPSLEQFHGREIVMTLKLDGENTTLYDDHIHARSLDSGHHPSRDWVKGLWSQIAYEIPAKWRICGENVYARHTIPYNNLDSYFYVISIWDENNTCLSWDETVEYCKMLNLQHVPVLYRGVFDIDKIKKSFPSTFNGDICEGYVIRIADSFPYTHTNQFIGKFVSKSFEITGANHWSQNKVIPNLIRKTS